MNNFGTNNYHFTRKHSVTDIRKKQKPIQEFRHDMRALWKKCIDLNSSAT